MTCGDGIKSRTVQCSGGPNNCDPSTKPETSTKCSLSSCPQWRVSQWSAVRYLDLVLLQGVKSLKGGRFPSPQCKKRTRIRHLSEVIVVINLTFSCVRQRSFRYISEHCCRNVLVHGDEYYVSYAKTLHCGSYVAMFRGSIRS